MGQSFSINCSCAAFISRFPASLRDAHLTLVTTFDSQLSTGMLDELSSAGPDTGQEDQRLVICLIYAPSSPPATLLIRGNEQRAHVMLVKVPGQGLDPLLEAQVTTALQTFTGGYEFPEGDG